MLEIFRNWTITMTGGFAFYALLCMTLVTVYGIIEIGDSIIKLIKK